MGQFDSSRLKTLLLVDDEKSNLHVLKQILQDDYALLVAKDGEQALEVCRHELPDLVLLDVMMPGMSGYEVCTQLKADPATARIPVIFVTALSDVVDEAHGLEVGAVDYITKPINASVVKARVATHLQLVGVDELHESRQQLIRCLGRAAEYRDNETGLHVIRMSYFARLLGKAAGLSDAATEELFYAAPMHDVGKIGIPDRVLLKPGKLDPEEWVLMRQHPEIGTRIIGDQDSRLLRNAALISMTHHEKWDGSGYPRGLKGNEIPLVGRIIAVVDVFDALTTERPYKPPGL